MPSTLSDILQILLTIFTEETDYPSALPYVATLLPIVGFVRLAESLQEFFYLL